MEPEYTFPEADSNGDPFIDMWEEHIEIDKEADIVLEDRYDEWSYE